MPPRAPELYGIPIKEIARLCGISVRTARRWKQGTRCPPATALMILRQDLGCFDPKWSGWTLQNGLLVSPEGWRASIGDVLSIQLTQAQLSAYRHENRQLRAELDELELEEQPAPHQWEIAAG